MKHVNVNNERSDAGLLWPLFRIARFALVAVAVLYVAAAIALGAGTSDTIQLYFR